MERVPQFINVEDRIGPFTWKQLGWFAMATMIGGILWLTLSKTAFWIAIIPIFAFATALGFLKPGGVPLIKFIGFLFAFILQPKIYVWRREPLTTVERIKRKPEEKFIAEKRISQDEIEALSKLLDSHGKNNDARIEEILKKRNRL